MIERHIKYTKARNLGEIINVTFNYFGCNIKVIFTILSFYVMPFFAASILASFFLDQAILSFSNSITYIGNIANNDFIEYAVVLLTYFFGLTLQNQVISKHLIVNEKLDERQRVNSKHIQLNIVDDFRQHFPNVFFLALLLIIISLILSSAIGYLLVPDLSFSFSEDPLNFIMQIFPLFFFALLIIPLTFYILVATLFFAQRDQTGFFEALTKVANYVRENFLSTWLNSIVALLIVYFCNVFLRIPFILIGFMDIAVEPGMYFLITAIGNFIFLFAMTLFQLMCIFHLTSLEEKKEGSIIKQKIDNL